MSAEVMKPSIIFPFKELQHPAQIIDFAQAAEELGYEAFTDHDHVILSEERAGNNKYDFTVPFQEPFVLFGFLSGVTHKIKFVTGVLIPTQRPTALVAKQAAEVQRLSDGRLILGVGVGNNPIEFQAMGKPFENRGAKLEKQISVFRKLWKGEAVTETIGDEVFVDAKINPIPKHTIPIWIGGFANPVVDRAARIGDGYIPLGGPQDFEPQVIKLRKLLVKYDRDPEAFPVMGAFPKTGTFNNLGWKPIKDVIRRWNQLNISHLAFGTQNNGFGNDINKHIQLITDYIKVFQDSVG